MSSNRLLTLQYETVEHSLNVSTDSYLVASQLKEQFTKDVLPAAIDRTQELAGDNEPQTSAELLGKFIGYASTFYTNQDSKPIENDSFSHILKNSINDFERTFLQNSTIDIHSFVASLIEQDQTTLLKGQEIIKNYLLGKVTVDGKFSGINSTLIKNADKLDITAIFGGQGNTDDYFDELRDLVKTYDVIMKDLLVFIDETVKELSNKIENFNKIYTQGFDILKWLANPEQTPNTDYLLSIPVSCPVIGIIQLLNFAITCRLLGLNPGQLRASLRGATGHSQGLVTAIAIAESNDWESFFKAAKKGISLLFFIGCRCNETYPNTDLSPSISEDSVENGEGVPSPMLSISNLTKDQVQSHVDKTNSHLPKEKHVVISLVNGARNLVVSGPPQSLYGLNLSLRKLKVAAGLDQNRIPHSQRKLKFTNRFLPVTSPFHSHLLEPAMEAIEKDILENDITFKADSLKIPVYDTFTGDDLSKTNSENLSSRLALLIVKHPVNWELATNFPACSHILDFGPGGSSGLGVLTHRNKEGTGVRVILAGAFDVSADDEYGFKQEIFNIKEDGLKLADNWMKDYSPKLVQTKSGKVFVETKFSKLISRAPLLVPGMTPTTVSPDFVASTINAGYHIELAGGGYFSPNTMTKAIDNIISQIKPGYSIGINLIYVNPFMLQWGIPLIKELRSKGYPIQSLTIGAGVPSLEVATEYIETLGLKHLGLKPGSIDAISQVINIAKAHPNFPIVLQWTGGRGGGHHSFEDFHQPILQMYSKIRKYSNIHLIAGSGFGSAEDTYPYLTGEWSSKFNYPPMPFDGFLFGSRVMIAEEAKTSPDAKLAISKCSGVPDSEWEATYQKPTGGILTVKSEMGEPIHKIATRGVKFWKEMDDTIFSLPKNKLESTLEAKKDYIVSKLNADFQKPWFATVDGVAKDIHDMTYAEVANRLVELIFIKSTGKWIDPSLRNMTGDFLRRVEERFTKTKTASILQSYSSLDTEPTKILEAIYAKYPDSKIQFLNAQDVDFFLGLTTRRGQKPVPFVPILDKNFEFYFKKDSLWQSENLETVIDQDVERTCILHGPVAAQFTNKVDQPIKEIMDEIHEGHVAKLLKEFYNNDKSSIPVVEYFGNSDAKAVEFPHTASESGVKRYTCNGSTNVSEWFNLLAGSEKNWRHAFFTSDHVVQDKYFESNPAKKIFAPVQGSEFVVEIAGTGAQSKVTLFEKVAGALTATASLRLNADNVIEFDLIESRTVDSKPVALTLLFNYHPEDGHSPIHEVLEGRNERIKEMYWKLWLPGKVDLNFDVHAPIDGGSVKVETSDILNFTHAIGNNCEDFVPRTGRKVLAPMDFAIVLGWRSIIKAIFPKSVDGDLLKLVHMSNGYKMVPGAKPIQEGDVISTTALVKSVVNQPNGKVVEVVGTLSRASQPVMEVSSKFFYRGAYTDFENTFERISEVPYKLDLTSAKDVAVLQSKEWFNLDSEIDLLGKTLFFKLQTDVTYKSADIFSSITSEGNVYYELPTKELVKIGEVNYEAGQSHGNPVIDYLSRNGTTTEEKVAFENEIPIAVQQTQSPSTNESYARVSGDLNPIHVSRHFAEYANLPGTITHGMYSSASVRSLVETWAADNVSSRVRAYKCDFTGMVLPNTQLTTSIKHVGMINGRKLIKFETKNANEETVLVGEAEVEQPVSTFVFTGQGSQEQGMGMDLYAKSEVARNVWDRADNHFKKTYGFSILEIVKKNPNELTIYFGGEKGKKIKENYTSMMFETIVDGELKSEKIFKDIVDTTSSYTFQSPTGLLSATQFTQPALTLMEKAAFEDLKAKGLIPSDAPFAGHSLGEYAALASLADVMSIESLVEVVFYRGMTMQVAVPRDSSGRSNYGMIAVNPGRVHPSFSQEALQFVVQAVANKTEWLLEIVNYNVENQQYVAAGDLRALDTLGNVLNVFKLQKINFVKLQESMTLEELTEHLDEITAEVSAKSVAKPQPIDLERGFATIPLKGISVPFHSSYLMSGVKPFKNFLKKNIVKENVKADRLVGKYIPNLTAKPFELTKEYFEDVYEITKSEKIKEIIENWENYQ